MANPIVTQIGGSTLAFTIKPPSCCGETKYEFFRPNDEKGQPVFVGILNKSSCGGVTIKIQDKQSLTVCTLVIANGCCVAWSVKNGQDETIGHLRHPTFCQKLHARCCPCSDAILLRATDSGENQRFTLREPGSCFSCCNCALKCPHCKKCHCCALSTKFHFNLPVYDGDEAKADPVAELNWDGVMSGCCLKTLQQGYVVTLNLPNNVNYNDTCLLLLLAVYADERFVAPLRSISE